MIAWSFLEWMVQREDTAIPTPTGQPDILFLMQPQWERGACKIEEDAFALSLCLDETLLSPQDCGEGPEKQAMLRKVYI